VDDDEARSDTVGLLDRLLGRRRDSEPAGWPSGRDATSPSGAPSSGAGQPGQTSDQAAIERYRYLLRTAPPEAIEQAHAEAFAQLTPQQRRQVLADVGAAVPPAERATSDDPASLARMATRAELRQPGTMERVLGRPGGMGGMGGGIGLGGVIAGSLLASVAGAFVGTAIAEQLFNDSGAGDSGAGDSGAEGADGQGGDAQGGGEPQAAADTGDAGAGFDSGDYGGGDLGGF
jgi:hypothetical protein